MIPRIGFVGAAWATLIGEGITVWLTARTADRALPGMHLLRLAFARPLVVAALVLAGGLGLRQAGVHPAITSLGAGSVFVILLFVTGAFDRSDRETLRSLVRRRGATPETETPDPD
jgi:O-antigen/teichoic acid export membrane protein